MKYLISLKESFGLNNDLREYIDDILIDVKDLGLTVKVDEVRDGSSFTVSISNKFFKNYFKVNDIYLQLLALDSYMKSIGWTLYFLSCTYYSNDLGHGHKIYLTGRDSDIYSKIEDFKNKVENDSNKISYIELSFLKK
jgi:hypothetical protein